VGKYILLHVEKFYSSLPHVKHYCTGHKEGSRGGDGYLVVKVDNGFLVVRVGDAYA
jgi:hypothetical protein